MVDIVYPWKIGVMLGLLNLMIPENTYRNEFSHKKILFLYAESICFQEYSSFMRFIRALYVISQKKF